jgi:HPt (histidine-containing phosphotransfer) domain-containing protein
MSPGQVPATWRRAATVLTGCVLAAALAGCSGAAPELETAAAAKLQQRVLELTKSAAGSNPAAALKSLASLSSELDAAAAAGQVVPQIQELLAAHRAWERFPAATA